MPEKDCEEHPAGPRAGWHSAGAWQGSGCRTATPGPPRRPGVPPSPGPQTDRVTGQRRYVCWSGRRGRLRGARAASRVGLGAAGGPSVGGRTARLLGRARTGRPVLQVIADAVGIGQGAVEPASSLRRCLTHAHWEPATPPHTDSPEGARADTDDSGCRPLSQVWDDWERQVPPTRPLPSARTDERVRSRAASPRPAMDLVRHELRPGRPLSSGRTRPGLSVMETVAGRASFGGRDGRRRACRGLPHPGQAPPAPSRSRRHPCARIRGLRQLAERVREAADQQLGMVVASVDIRVTGRVDHRAEGREGDAATTASRSKVTAYAAATRTS